MFAFRVLIPDFARAVKVPPIYLRGLQPRSLYRVEGFDKARSCLAWMEASLTLEGSKRLYELWKQNPLGRRGRMDRPLFPLDQLRQLLHPGLFANQLWDRNKPIST